ncbi:MAG: DUF3179 domain-containing protein [Chloroflexales bacterium]|nr:DUF3179 domain-containing protein [Chloroflexales bacterium]
MHKMMYAWVVIAGLLLTACGAANNAGSSAAEAKAESPPADTPTESPSATEPVVQPTLDPEESPPGGAAAEFTTDFSKHSVPYREILSGGPPKDGIPAIDNPSFVAVEEADEWLSPVEPVVLVEINGDARAYPLQILTWHEIVNDTVGGTPVAVTFCPLCNTAIVFERTVDAEVLDFGTTGRLRFSNLIMYDRQTETWWQQGTGEAIAGELTRTQLTFHPAALIAWSDFKATHPDGQVLSRETGYNRSYGQNPYTGYDNVNNSPFLYRGPETPGTLPAVARVLTVDLKQETVAYPYTVLEEQRVVNDTVAGAEVVVFWQPGAASALDTAAIADGRDVGAASAYARELDGRQLTFSFNGTRIVDNETGSEWDVLGQAIGGELAGAQLTPIVAVNHFWFSWAAFKPETRIYQP